MSVALATGMGGCTNRDFDGDGSGGEGGASGGVSSSSGGNGELGGAGGASGGASGGSDAGGAGSGGGSAKVCDDTLVFDEDLDSYPFKPEVGPDWMTETCSSPAHQPSGLTSTVSCYVETEFDPGFPYDFLRVRFIASSTTWATTSVYLGGANGGSGLHIALSGDQISLSEDGVLRDTNDGLTPNVDYFIELTILDRQAKLIVSRSAFVDAGGEPEGDSIEVRVDSEDLIDTVRVSLRDDDIDYEDNDISTAYDLSITTCAP